MPAPEAFRSLYAIDLSGFYPLIPDVTFPLILHPSRPAVEQKLLGPRNPLSKDWYVQEPPFSGESGLLTQKKHEAKPWQEGGLLGSFLACLTISPLSTKPMN